MSGGGALVTTHWGYSIRDVIKRHSGMRTAILSLHSKLLGVADATSFNDVLISVKRGDRSVFGRHQGLHELTSCPGGFVACTAHGAAGEGAQSHSPGSPPQA